MRIEEARKTLLNLIRYEIDEKGDLTPEEEIEDICKSNNGFLTYANSKSYYCLFVMNFKIVIVDGSQIHTSVLINLQKGLDKLKEQYKSEVAQNEIPY